ncbi:MAG: hypothetical protein IKH54_00740 [Bacilli bacterium]|nr:hypothetical protein [Bacilli bacterium]
MAVGVNTDKVNSLKIYLLDSIESLKKIRERYESCQISILANIDGSGKSNISSDLNKLKSQLAIAISNIDTYIVDLNKIVDTYKNQDYEVSKQIIKDVDKVVDMRGE